MIRLHRVSRVWLRQLPQQFESQNGIPNHLALISRSFAAGPSNQMALIKRLREETGAPIGDVKSALQTADWDLEKAGQELRKKGLAAASKKASRHAAEGLVGIAHDESGAAIVEINSETDFVARNEQFRQLVGSVAASVLKSAPSTTSNSYDIDTTTLTSIHMDNKTLSEAVADVAGSVRENIRLRRGLYLSGSKGLIGSYVHGSVAPGLGRIASLVLLQHEGTTNTYPEALKDLAHKLAMHVVGALPRYLDKSLVPEEALDQERALLKEQAERSGKPANIVEKMVQGRLGKFYEDVCFVEQPWILDDKKKVKDVVTSAGKEAGLQGLHIGGFVRVQVGEGLEKEGGKDFATEVAETLKAAG